MLQFDGGQAQTSAAFPNWPGSGAIVLPVEAVPTTSPVLGPTMQATGVTFNVFNALVDVEGAVRDKEGGGGIGWQPTTVLQGLTPGPYVFPGWLGCRFRSHNHGEIAQVTAQVWETVDGPMPNQPLGGLGYLSPSGAALATPLLNLQFTTVGPGNTPLGPAGGMSLPGNFPGVIFGAVNNAGQQMDVDIISKPQALSGPSIESLETFGFPVGEIGLFYVPVFGELVFAQARAPNASQASFVIYPANGLSQFKPPSVSDPLINWPTQGMGGTGFVQEWVPPYDGEVHWYATMSPTGGTIVLDLNDYASNALGRFAVLDVPAGVNSNFVLKHPTRMMLMTIFQTPGNSFNVVATATPRRGGA